jgi:hypothetical protein
MPEFRVEVEAQDWWDEAYDSERNEMIEIVREEAGIVSDKNAKNLMHEEFLGSLDKLSANYYMMTKEEIDLLLSLAKRF